MTEIKVRDVPELRLVTESRSVDQAALEAWLPGAMARVSAAAGDPLTADSQPWLERDTADPVFVVSYEGNPNEGPTLVEVCAPVTAGGDRIDPAHREAYARVTKGQVTSGQLGGVYEAVEKWASDQGLRITAAPRETYWTDFMAAGDDDEVFDIAFPVA
jgi:hypothetical protein